MWCMGIIYFDENGTDVFSYVILNFLLCFLIEISGLLTAGEKVGDADDFLDLSYGFILLVLQSILKRAQAS